MLEKIITWDQELFLYLNGLHHPVLDSIMVFVSNSYIPIILITVLFLSYGYYKLKNKIFIAFIFILLGVGISDGISSRISKPTFKRLRPCKEVVIKDKVNIPSGNCYGGKYGFFSSHASNSFVVAMFIWLLFKSYSKQFFWLFPYATLVSYSRIYMAKHYPLDIIVGAMFGILIALFVFKIYAKFFSVEKSFQGQL